MVHIPDHYLDLLSSTALAYVATMGPQGAPHVSPVWFGWDGTQVFFSMNKVRQKRRNLVRNPQIAIAITDPTNPYRSIELRGVARIEDDLTYHYQQLLSQKYLNRAPTPQENPPGEARVVVFVEPQHVVSFQAEPA